MAVLTISFQDCRLLLLLLWDPIKGEETDFLCSDKEAVVKVKYSHPIIIADSQLIHSHVCAFVVIVT